MEIETKTELAKRAFFLNENIKTCILNIRDNYLELGMYAAELKKGKLYKLIEPEAKTWEHYISLQNWGLKRAQVDNYSQIALLIGDEISGRDIPLNRAIDITRVVSKLPAEEQKQAIDDLVEGSETLPKSGWDDCIRELSGKITTDCCEHNELEIFNKCKVCGKWFKP